MATKRGSSSRARRGSGPKKRAASSRSKSSKGTSSRRYGPAASKSVESAMRREKKGTLRSGPGGKGGKVTNPKQAIAIGLSEARKKGAKVPARRRGSR